jgi:hypothetical protein
MGSALFCSVKYKVTFSSANLHVFAFDEIHFILARTTNTFSLSLNLSPRHDNNVLPSASTIGDFADGDNHPEKWGSMDLPLRLNHQNCLQSVC